MRIEPSERPAAAVPRSESALFRKRLNRNYSWYTVGFIAFVLVLAVLEQLGLPKRWIGALFLLATVALYASVGILARTTDSVEYYVAGRRVPAVYNGMATAADWMSAASFMGLAGTLYLSGYGGLAFVLGWTGGFCLVALLLAPYLRRFGEFTIPDFIGARYGGGIPRLVAVLAAVLCSFTYVVAQIYGIGLITARLTGVEFEIGIFLGLGGILVCSFLGGMRAVTWTQIAQYIVLLAAYLVPVAWLSIKQTGFPVPQVIYGQQLQKLGERETQLKNDPKEREVVAAFQARADASRAKLVDVPAALHAEHEYAEQRLATLKAQGASLATLQRAEKTSAAVPKTEDEARAAWSAAAVADEARAKPLAGMPDHAEQFAGNPDGTPEERRLFDESRRNFLALTFCLMIGTAALPHILTRYYTTPSVREARQSVTWSLFFILLLYLTAPALAVLVKYEVFNTLVGTPFDRLPAWIANWSKVDPGLMSVVDINGDGLLQLGEMKIGGDIIMLATPEIAGLPYVVSGMVCAGGLAAALSTADGLLLTISNALSHDLYHKMVDPQASTAKRVALSKVLLLAAALAAAAIATYKPADILFLVSSAFSLAAAAFFPALVLGVFWQRANRWGATFGMVAGLSVTIYYMATTHPGLRDTLRITGPIELWWGIAPVSAGIFGMPVGFAVMLIASWLTPRDSLGHEMAERVRYPTLKL
ncbi:MAG: putative rane transport protein [Rhizobacter sp.]|nr:putative rane transport protein [Rhizobacter sp.]